MMYLVRRKPSLLIVLCLFTCSTLLHAQDDNRVDKEGVGSENTSGKNPDWVLPGDILLRWQPLGLLNTFDMNLTIGAEYAYKKNKSFSLDAGYVFASTYGNATNDLMPASGYSLRLMHRWYYGRYTPWFVEPEVGIKNVRYKSEERWVGRGVVNGVPAYEELMQVISKKEVFTATVRTGLRKEFGANGGVALELWAGLGMRYRNYYPDMPADSDPFVAIPWFFTFFDYDKGWYPEIPMGLRLVFKIE